MVNVLIDALDGKGETLAVADISALMREGRAYAPSGTCALTVIRGGSIHRITGTITDMATFTIPTEFISSRDVVDGDTITLTFRDGVIFTVRSDKPTTEIGGDGDLPVPKL